jgi:hypothetical protein
MLTAEGVQQLSVVIGTECASSARSVGVSALVLGSTPSSAEVLVHQEGPCRTLARFTLEPRLGRLIAVEQALAPMQTPTVTPSIGASSG